MYALAPAPTRPTTSITLAAGLLNIPLSVYTSTEATRVSRKEFLGGDPTIEVGRSPIRKDTGAVVETADVTRMAQASNGTWVVLNDDEIAACTSERGVAEIVTFVSTKDFDNYLTEGLYQVRPKVEKGQRQPVRITRLRSAARRHEGPQGRRARQAGDAWPCPLRHPHERRRPADGAHG